MFSFVSIFLASVSSLMIKILELILKHLYRSKSSLAQEKASNFGEDRSQLDDEAVSQNSSVVFLENEIDSRTESSVFYHNGLLSSSSKCQIMAGKNVSGFLEEAKPINFVVQEMFVSSSSSSDRIIASEFMGLEQNMEQDSAQESEASPFYFKLLNPCVYANYEEIRENLPELAKCMDDDDDVDQNPEILEGNQEIPEFVEDDHKEENPEFVEDDHKEENPEFVEDNQQNPEFVEDNQENPELVEENQENPEFVEDDQREESPEFLEDEDCAYEVELIPDSGKDEGTFVEPRRIEKNDSKDWMSSFLEETDHTTIDAQSFKNSSEEEVLDDEEFIELELYKESEETKQEHEQKTWDSDSDEEEDEEGDVLSQHQQLVEQMKMELKNCRTRGLPTISEESETPKIVEDLRPLRIDNKVGYKDVMERIQSFYKSYAEKMRKLDILNYQTSHAINFLHMKDSEAFTSFKNRANSLLPRILVGKVRRVYADPMHKSIEEMNRDLEVVYVGQMCLSWEILWWLDARTRELLVYEVEGSHSFNQAFEDFQQFQVLVQRFVEDELFKGRRHENYVESRSVIRSLLQIPTIKDDCLKKEKREDGDAITLEMLADIIFETMSIFREFVFSDKKATDSSIIAKLDVRESGSSELMADVVSTLEKKGRRMKELVRSESCCILKKMKKKKSEERGLMDREILAAQVDLRLIWRVLNMARLNGDQLIWCKNKLDNINFVGRKVRREACFLLFPC